MPVKPVLVTKQLRQKLRATARHFIQEQYSVRELLKLPFVFPPCAYLAGLVP